MYVRRPRTDAAQRGQLGMDGRLARVIESIEVKRTILDGGRKSFQRGDLRSRKPGTAQVSLRHFKE
jgi:hypothetical protein